MKYLKVREAADIARKHPDTVRKALEVGRLHGFQDDKFGHWTVKAECLEAWVERRPCPHQQSNVTQISGKRSA